MARVRLIHWNGPEGRECRQRLAALGHTVYFDDCAHPGLMKVLRANLPDAFVIDLSRAPSMGQHVAMALRSSKATRQIPILFVDGDPEKVAKIRANLADATYTGWGRLKTAIPKAIANAPADVIVPPSSIYTGRPLVDKLGVKAKTRLCLVGAPPGFAGMLTPLPAGVKFTAKPDAACDLFLVFVRGLRELAAHLGSLAPLVDRQTVWMIWPKKASGVKSDLNGNVVRETGLAAGWVDFKICSVDDTWSALAFKKRR